MERLLPACASVAPAIDWSGKCDREVESTTREDPATPAAPSDPTGNGLSQYHPTCM